MENVSTSSILALNFVYKGRAFVNFDSIITAAAGNIIQVNFNLNRCYVPSTDENFQCQEIRKRYFYKIDAYQISARFKNFSRKIHDTLAFECYLNL